MVGPFTHAELLAIAMGALISEIIAIEPGAE
jgi:hypothetical protein